MTDPAHQDPPVLPHATPGPEREQAPPRPSETAGGRHAALVVIVLASVVLDAAAFARFPMPSVLVVVLGLNAVVALSVPAVMVLTRPAIHWAAATLFVFTMTFGVAPAAALIAIALRRWVR